MKAILVLEDGFQLEGKHFAGPEETSGEVVFTTSMTGYQEVLTDPSYRGQIVTFTFPLIGNYGVNPEDMESTGCHPQGIIIREYCPFPSNWRSRQSLKELLEEESIMGIEGIDTRALTRHLRRYGSRKGIISSSQKTPSQLLKDLKEKKDPLDRDLVSQVTGTLTRRDQGTGSRVVVLDLGVKFNILRSLKAMGCEVTVVPADTSAREIMALKPDGILVSNGPGDPRNLSSIIGEIKKLLGRRPLFGICLGHQLIGLALGLEVYQLKFGHHGSNHPVREVDTGRVEVTSQNHNYCLHRDSFPAKGSLRITHLNLNDGTVEGMEDREQEIFSLQYHPEAAPGPHDANHYFEDFLQLIKGNLNNKQVQCQGA